MKYGKQKYHLGTDQSHLARGAWIEMYINGRILSLIHCRTSQEVRGLKYFCQQLSAFCFGRTSQEVRGLKYELAGMQSLAWMSHLARGAWIEILNFVVLPVPIASRTSQEVRGLKFLCIIFLFRGFRRTSQEVRGLKCWSALLRLCRCMSHLARGAWIEIDLHISLYLPLSSHLARGAWIEIEKK